ncbi:hypothetical protein MRB53_037389 [Persea americana]|nr:hypothetical protein MRB53_037389 [Persea americana]
MSPNLSRQSVDGLVWTLERCRSRLTPVLSGVVVIVKDWTWDLVKLLTREMLVYEGVAIETELGDDVVVCEPVSEAREDKPEGEEVHELKAVAQDGAALCGRVVVGQFVGGTECGRGTVLVVR